MENMKHIDGDWFREIWDNDGLSTSFKIEEVLFHEKSKYQDILVFKSKSFGNVLVLDGIVQCSERDEFAYQEMIAHLPISCHGCPKKVLVVGGGDGGVVREVLKHKNIQSCVLCEIDEKVVEVSRQYLKGMSQSLDDPRLTIHIGDGVQYMKENKGQFDVIITDAPDPLGVAEGLFQRDYYQNMNLALAPGGIICSQGENMYLDLEFIKKLVNMARSCFPSVAYAFTTMPSYTGGNIGFILCSTNVDIQFDKPHRCYSEEEVTEMNLQYYNTQIHSASFVLPQFLKKKLTEKDTDDHGILRIK